MEQPFVIDGDHQADGAHRRTEPRDSLLFGATVGRRGEAPASARIRNLSPGGLMADCGASFAKGEAIEIELRGVGLVTGRVAWTGQGGRIGVAFDRRIDPALARRPLAGGPQPMLVKAAPAMRRPGLREPVHFVPARKFR